MHVSKILIENFKCIRKLEIYPNENFNVIIGENSQGKTTIFEALQLWYRCYHLYIQRNKRDFYTGDNLYMAYKDLNFLRLKDDVDLFKQRPNECSIGLTLMKDGNEYPLIFKITRPQVIANAYFRIQKRRVQPFRAFAEKMQNTGTRLDSAIYLYQTNPISSVLSEEPFMNLGQVSKKMMRGKTQEVLRNKIRNHSNSSILNEQVSFVLEKPIEFIVANQEYSHIDEYINIRINRGGRGGELYMQGSGLLQVTEIFATLNYLDAELNILLIDEPDSHIHSALQKRLISKIKDLSGNQTFIISHNDLFVSEVGDGELYYLNKDSKTRGELKPLEDFDLIKRDFGNPIIALEKLNHSENIVFVEGKDDKVNIENLKSKYLEAGYISDASLPKTCQFFHIRGKDNVLFKIESSKRTLEQLFRDKTYVIITDKDFASLSSSSELNELIRRKAGEGSIAFCHDGYCMESTLFSDINALFAYLKFKTPIDAAAIQLWCNSYFETLKSNLQNVSSTEYQSLNDKFDSQKRNRRELQNIDFSSVVRDATTSISDLKFIMNKGHIINFIEAFENQFGVSIVTRTGDDSAEYFCSQFFSDYVDSIPTHRILYDAHKNLLNSVYNLSIT